MIYNDAVRRLRHVLYLSIFFSMAGQDPAIQTNFTARLDGRILAAHGEEKEFVIYRVAGASTRLRMRTFSGIASA